MPFPLTVINISILVLVLVALISLILLLRNYLSREKVLVYYPEHDPLNLNTIDDTNFSEFGEVSSSEDFNSSRKLNKKANKKNKKNKKNIFDEVNTNVANENDLAPDKVPEEVAVVEPVSDTESWIVSEEEVEEVAVVEPVSDTESWIVSEEVVEEVVEEEVEEVEEVEEEVEEENTVFSLNVFSNDSIILTTPAFKPLKKNPKIANLEYGLNSVEAVEDGTTSSSPSTYSPPPQQISNTNFSLPPNTVQPIFSVPQLEVASSSTYIVDPALVIKPRRFWHRLGLRPRNAALVDSAKYADTSTKSATNKETRHRTTKSYTTISDALKNSRKTAPSGGLPRKHQIDLDEVVPAPALNASTLSPKGSKRALKKAPRVKDINKTEVNSVSSDISPPVHFTSSAANIIANPTRTSATRKITRRQAKKVRSQKLTDTLTKQDNSNPGTNIDDLLTEENISPANTPWIDTVKSVSVSNNSMGETSVDNSSDKTQFVAPSDIDRDAVALDYNEHYLQLESVHEARSKKEHSSLYHSTPAVPTVDQESLEVSPPEQDKGSKRYLARQAKDALRSQRKDRANKRKAAKLTKKRSRLRAPEAIAAHKAESDLVTHAREQAQLTAKDATKELKTRNAKHRVFRSRISPAVTSPLPLVESFDWTISSVSSISSEDDVLLATNSINLSIPEPIPPRV